MTEISFKLRRETISLLMIFGVMLCYLISSERKAFKNSGWSGTRTLTSVTPVQCSSSITLHYWENQKHWIEIKQLKIRGRKKKNDYIKEIEQHSKIFFVDVAMSTMRTTQRNFFHLWTQSKRQLRSSFLLCFGSSPRNCLLIYKFLLFMVTVAFSNLL